MNIDGNTRLIGLIGNPVEHTLSPVIHNGISERMGIKSVYVPFKVEALGLDAAVRGAYELNILGMNVTVPHKNQVIESLVKVDEAARQIGAVNTLVRIERDGESLTGYKGYNTDMLGLRRQITEDGIALAGETVVILGAGGAAKAVVYMCLLEGAKKVYLLNRTVEKAESIAESMNGGSTLVIPMALADYYNIKEETFIAFQATSIGLSPNTEDVVIDDMAFYKKVKAGVDLIYNPADTKFMKLVTAAGGKAYNALKMLLYQGVIAYELWHNITVPQEVIDDIYVELKRRVYPKDNIVLIGFMGSGKTTFGKALAGKLRMDFLDTDAYIEKQAGKSISQIFAEDGEDAFRRLETEVLEHFRDTAENTVFSTGGGMPLRTENARLLKEIGKVYHLTAANQVIFDRVKGNKSRPLLQCDNPYEKICSLMKERMPLYEAAADVRIDTNSTDTEEICSMIIKEYSSR
ncbi:MAG: shikimate dehydrogenase [Lachnospiraceae bacterium]|nr:shikimate dehydrogenase [Lachnospiraceae bacterium]